MVFITLFIILYFEKLAIVLRIYLGSTRDDISVRLPVKHGKANYRPILAFSTNMKTPSGATIYNVHPCWPKRETKKKHRKEPKPARLGQSKELIQFLEPCSVGTHNKPCVRS